jgi:Fe-S oxidoreductase
MHSTRGRANLLRAMIRGPWTTDDRQSMVHGLSSFDKQKVDAAAQALDLCLACKGCKSECPSGVDMAKLKFAFQAEYYKTHRRQLRDYAFGYFHVTAGLAASIAPVSNALMGIPIIKNLVARILGITPERPFPKFSSWRARVPTTETRRHSERRKKVIFLADAFARYLEPETEQAALDILAGCGFEVHVLPVLGAGASFLSKGFIDQAKRHAGRVLDALNRIDPAREIPVLGIEPPEVYAFKHDYVDLLPSRREEIRQRVDKAWFLDEFLLRSPEFADLRIASREQLLNNNNGSTRKVNFHPHCHQRAEGPSSDGLPSGTNATLELLHSCGYEIELMDTGCCGMAGTFGYEAEHYEVSMKVGELKLFPALRQSQIVDRQSSTLAPGASAGVANHQSSIVSSGAACRMQIRQGTGVEAVHPIILISNFLRETAK